MSRLRSSYFFTLREAPAKASVPHDHEGHGLLLRAGYVRRAGPGLYAQLPLLLRVLHKIERVVREELDAIGAQEVALPHLQSAELWRESGRWDVYTRGEGIMFTLRDRQERDFALGPTHEEAVTQLARETIRSRRDLPAHLYQIGAKFRDELRPRGLLLRSREFVMKDGYSFDADEEGLRRTYEAVGQVYERIFARCGLKVRAVDADSGAIGGGKSREFMVLAPGGDDEVLYTADGRYAANVEKAESKVEDAVKSTFTACEPRLTPNAATITKVCAALNCHPSQVVKNVLYDAVFDNGLLVPVIVSIRGDQEVNPVKLAGVASGMAGEYGAGGLLSLEVAETDKWAARKVPLGYIAPDLGDGYIAEQEGVAPAFLRLVDHTAASLRDFVTGANQAEYHVVGANWGEQYARGREVDVRLARAGERSPYDPNVRLQSARGIEVGHIFQLGTRYSAAMGATYAATDGGEQFLWMGSYGIGLTRLAQAAAEQHADARGLVWPAAIAPYSVIVTVTGAHDPEQLEAGEHLYKALRTAHIDTVLDDRDERAGVKFKDADLIGIPYRVTVGRGLKNGVVELSARATGETREVPVEEVANELLQRLGVHEDAQREYSYSL